MADANDVNAQHLAAMGLAEQPLGQPYQRGEHFDHPTSNEGRCESITDGGFRCARQESHTGAHARGSLTWFDPDPTEPGEVGSWRWMCGFCSALNGIDHDPTGANAECPVCNRVTLVERAHPQWGPVPTDPAKTPVEPFIYTTWDEVPWVEGCVYCSSIRSGNEDIRLLINHMAEHGAATSLPSAYTVGGQGGPTYPTKTREGDQVLPDADESVEDDQALLIADIEARRQVGIERYGQGHRPFNGRNTIQDAYEEAIDGAVYLRSLLRVREATREELTQVVTKDVLATLEPYLRGTTGDTVSAQIADVVVNRLLDWVTVKSNEVPWAKVIVDAYYNGVVIDFEGQDVPPAVQGWIAAREAELEAERG